MLQPEGLFFTERMTRRGSVQVAEAADTKVDSQPDK